MGVSDYGIHVFRLHKNHARTYNNINKEYNNKAKYRYPSHAC